MNTPNDRKTFPRSVEHARKKISWLNVLAIIMREHFHNIRGAKGTWVKTAMLRYQGSDWLVTAHNGLPFDGKDELKECLQYGSSKGSSGALGNGMKATVIISNKSYTNVNNEIIVLSRRLLQDKGPDSFFGAKTFTVDQLQYDVGFLSDKDIRKIGKTLPHFFREANVMYLNKISGLKEGEYFLTQDRVRAITQWVDDDLLDIFVDGVEVYDERDYHFFSEFNPLEEQLSIPPRTLITNRESREKYSKEEVFINAKASLKGTLEKIYGPTCNVDLHFQHHLLFSDNKGKYVNLRTGALEDGTMEPNRYRYFASLTDPVSFAAHGILDRVKRLEEDPVYVTNLEPKNLHSVSFSISTPQRIDDMDDIKTAWDIANKNERISWPLPKQVKFLTSMVTIDIRISVSEDLQSCRELIIGDYNELFFSDEAQTLRDIVHEAINELLEDENVDLTEFVSLVEQYLPEKSDNFAPLPGDVSRNPKKKDCLYVFERNQDGSKGNPWKSSDKFDLGKDHNVVLADQEGTPIENTKLETVGENSGVTFSKLSGKGAFKISVDNLFELNDRGEIENDNITNTEYFNLSPQNRGPDRRIRVKVVGSGVKTLVNSVDTPLPPRNRSEYDKEYNRDRRIQHGDNRTNDRYIDFDNPELIGKYDRAKGVLFLNRNNELVKFYWLVQGNIKYDRFLAHRDALYIQMEDDARVMSDAISLMKEIEYKEPEDYVPNFTIIPEDYLLNQTLSMAIESSNHANIIKERTTESHMTLDEFRDIAKAMSGGALDNQAEIAKKVGISQPSVSNYMKGNPISRGIAEKIRNSFEAWKELNEYQDTA